MSSKVKVMMFISIIVVSLSVAAIAYMYMTPCEFCQSKLCNGNCVIIYDDLPTVSNNKIKPNPHKTNQKATRLVETQRADQSYLDRIVFVGDSRTVGLKLCTEVKEENIFAEEGLNHEDALNKPVVKVQEYKSVSIPEAVKLAVPDIMIVNFGINGIKWMDIPTFMEGYEKLIDELINNSPNSIIIIEAILPVSMTYEQRSDGVSNEKIDQANEQLFAMAKEKGLYYLGTNEVMKNDSNCLIAEYSGDGLHYNQEGYDVIMDYIMTHAIYKKTAF